MYCQKPAQNIFENYLFQASHERTSIYATVDFGHVKQKQMIRMVRDTIYDAVEFRSGNKKEEDVDSD